ncbi:MAG: hypothetical protein RSA45_05485 [Hydrogenoanaerobacterium sp.]
MHKLRRFPSEWADLPLREQAAIFAFIDEKIKQDKKDAAKAKSAKRRR